MSTSTEEKTPLLSLRNNYNGEEGESNDGDQTQTNYGTSFSKVPIMGDLEQDISALRKQSSIMSSVMQEETENSSQQNMVFLNFLKNWRLPPVASQIFVYILLPVIIWCLVYLVVGNDNLPGGTVFCIVLLECGGRLLGYLVSLIRLPPMVGMLGLGIAVGNIPQLGLTLHWNPIVSAPIRQLALAVILTRAGFGLDGNTLVKFKWLVLRLAVLPTVLESLSVAVLTHFLLGFPWTWGILVGFVVAAVSPAVIVPRILEIKAKGYGEDKGVPTVLLASASLDNVVAISLFGVALGFVFSTSGVTQMILQCPLEIICGCGFGLVWGAVTSLVFNPSPNENESSADESVVKAIFVLGGGIVSIFGFKLVNYSGAGALGCIISAFVTCTIWKIRGFGEKEINEIKWGFTFLWNFFEPLLFGVIGLQIIIRDLEGHTVLMSVISLVIGAVIRFAVTYGTVAYAGYNMKEKLFVAISWIPKATVQAAIGPIALDYVKNTAGSSEAQLQLANQVLTMAVVVILLTAPIGEFAVILTGPKFLSREKTDKNSDQENGGGMWDKNSMAESGVLNHSVDFNEDLKNTQIKQ